MISKMVNIRQAHRFESRESIRRLIFKQVMGLVDDDHHDAQFLAARKVDQRTFVPGTDSA
jgi:hypothetical protein